MRPAPARILSHRWDKGHETLILRVDWGSSGISSDIPASVADLKANAPALLDEYTESHGIQKTIIDSQVRRERLERNWGPSARLASLKLLHALVEKHKELALFKERASKETPPGLPILKRLHSSEELPCYLHGAEGAIVRLQGDLGIYDGNGCIPLGGTQLGSELVLQWWVGEEPSPAAVAEKAKHTKIPQPHKADAGHPEATEELLNRLAYDALLASTSQPKYVVVLESVGVSGGARSLEGNWQRVFVDPPEPLPVLTSAPGSLLVPLSPSLQNLTLTPPPAGVDWPENGLNALGLPFERTSRDLRGGIRIVGLKPNTCYAFRARAYSRAGAGPYVFGAYTTAPSPPPAPLPALPSYVPRGILASEGAAEMVASGATFQPDGVTLIWDKGVDFRAGLLRLLRLFATVTKISPGEKPAGKAIPSTGKKSSLRHTSDGTSATSGYEDEDGIMNYEDESDAGARGLFDASTLARRESLLNAIKCEVGMANWLAACCASLDFWPIKEGEKNSGRPLYMVVEESERDGGEGGFRAKSPRSIWAVKTRPVSVLEVMVKDHRGDYSWADVISLFSPDADERTPSDLLLAGLQPTPPPIYDSTLPPEAADALFLAPSTATALAAINNFKGHSSRPSSASKYGPVALDNVSIASAHGGKSFNIAGGAFSDLSQRNASLRTSQTRLTHTFLASQGQKLALLAAGGDLASSRPGSSSGRDKRPSSANAYSTGALGASAVLPGGGAIGEATARSRPMTANSTMSSTTLSTIVVHPKGAVRPISDVSLRYSLQECDSDGPLGQEWREVYLGVRNFRIMDKLYSGTSYGFKVQAINQDGVGSLFGPQCIVTTALPAPSNLRFLGAINATSVTAAWDAVSSANPLTTARALGKAPGSEDEEKEEEGTDIDAILDALVKKTKTHDDGMVEGEGGLTLKTAAAAVPVREGDLGWGCDLQRVWSRYDKEGRGIIGRKSLRGLLCDLGAYHESARLVFGASDPNEGSSSSGESAAQVGPLEWRLAAAMAALDPTGSDKIKKQDFADWWNAIDAALEKAANVNSAPGTPARGTSRASSAASLRPSASGFPSLSRELGISCEDEDLKSAVVYVLECRRFVPSEEVTAAAAAVVDATSRTASSNSTRPRSSSGSRPTSARSTLHTPISLALTAGGLKEAAEEAAALSTGSYTPWSVVYMGSTPRFRLRSLLPNAQYELRVTAIGRHAASNPTRPIRASLPPLAPFAPVMVRVAPRTATLRWYPQAMGADKYEVQVKLMEALAPPGQAGSSGRRENDGGIVCGRNFSELDMRALVTSGEQRVSMGETAMGGRGLWAEDADIGGEMGKTREQAWATMYTGMHTFTTITGLLANTVYRVRVLAYSSAGTPSRPSHELQLVTIDNSKFSPITVASVVKDFVVQCKPVVDKESAPPLSATTSVTLPPTLSLSPILEKVSRADCATLQDLVVGDTIVWTEDVWINGKAPLDKFHPAPPKEVAWFPGPDCIHLTNRTIAAQILGDSASKLGQGTGNSANVGGELGPMPVGAMAKALTLVGKFPENARTRKENAESDPTTGTLEDAVKGRVLTLQVEWCTLAPGFGSRDSTVKVLRASHGPHALAASAPELYMKPMGCNIHRTANELSKLDVFRTKWVDEAGRWGFAEELGASYDR